MDQKYEFAHQLRTHVESDTLQGGSLRGGFSLVGRILDKVRSLNVSLDETSKRTLKAAALEVFDVFAKAIDIPLIPEATEESVEAWLRSMLADRLDVLLGLTVVPAPAVP